MVGKYTQTLRSLVLDSKMGRELIQSIAYLINLESKLSSSNCSLLPMLELLGSGKEITVDSSSTSLMLFYKLAPGSTVKLGCEETKSFARMKASELQKLFQAAKPSINRNKGTPNIRKMAC